MSEGPRYSIIPPAAATDRRLRGRDLQVLCILGSHTSKAGWCVRSQAKIAEQLGCSRPAVNAAFSHLIDCGYLEARAVRDRRLLTPDEATKAGTVKTYRVVIDGRDEEDLSAGLTGSRGRPVSSSLTGPVSPGLTPLTTSSNDQKVRSTKPKGKPEEETWVHRDDARWPALVARWRRERNRAGVPTDRNGGWSFPSAWVGEPPARVLPVRSSMRANEAHMVPSFSDFSQG